MVFSSASSPSMRKISPRRLPLLWARMVPSGMVTAMNCTSEVLAISLSRICRRTRASPRMLVRSMLSKAMIRELPFSASRRDMARSLRSMEARASRVTSRMRTKAVPPSSRPSGVFCCCASCERAWEQSFSRAAWSLATMLPVLWPDAADPGVWQGRLAARASRWRRGSSRAAAAERQRRIKFMPAL